jgi:hypothetical protein
MGTVNKNAFLPLLFPFLFDHGIKEDMMPMFNPPGINITGGPIFIPRKHITESYRSQQRRAKKRRREK